MPLSWGMLNWNHNVSFLCLFVAMKTEFCTRLMMWPSHWHPISPSQSESYTFWLELLKRGSSISWQWTESAQIKQLIAWQQWKQWISVHQKLFNQSVARREKQNAYFTTSTATIRCGNPQTVASFLVCHKYIAPVITYHEDTTEEHGLHTFLF